MHPEKGQCLSGCRQCLASRPDVYETLPLLHFLNHNTPPFQHALSPMQFFKSAVAVVALISIPTLINGLVEIETPLGLSLTVFQHLPQALHSLHNTPKCAQICLLDLQYKNKYASQCLTSYGPDRFACFCRSHAYQLGMERCFTNQCSKVDRDSVFNPPFCPRFCGLSEVDGCRQGKRTLRCAEFMTFLQRKCTLRINSHSHS